MLNVEPLILYDIAPGWAIKRICVNHFRQIAKRIATIGKAMDGMFDEFGNEDSSEDKAA